MKGVVDVSVDVIVDVVVDFVKDGDVIVREFLISVCVCVIICYDWSYF